MFDYILFDLDGTLTNPEVGITKSLIYALEKFNVKVQDKKELYCCIGPPLMYSFTEFFKFSREDAEKATEYYRECYSKTGLYENEVYDGIKDVLSALKKAGKTLILATAKPEPFANIILEHFGLAEYFDIVTGASFDETLNNKTDIITEALKRANINDKTKAVMIGDRFHDIEGAKINSIATIGVLYGFGTIEEMTEYKADYIAKTPQDILEIIGVN